MTQLELSPQNWHSFHAQKWGFSVLWFLCRVQSVSGVILTPLVLSHIYSSLQPVQMGTCDRGTCLDSGTTVPEHHLPRTSLCQAAHPNRYLFLPSPYPNSFPFLIPNPICGPVKSKSSTGLQYFYLLWETGTGKNFPAET